MKLATLELFRYSLPLTAPLSLGGKILRRREGILLRVTGDEGEEGWGEASPLPGFSTEGLEEAAGQLRELRKTLVGHEVAVDFVRPQARLTRELDRVKLFPSARFGVELALCNLYSASRGSTLAEALARQPARTVSVSGLLSGPEQEILRDARRMREAGYRSVKLKVGGRAVRDDARLARSVKETLGGDTSLRLDANRAWSFEEAKEFARAAAGLCCEYVEEPLGEPAHLARLVRETGLPVALDESLIGVEPENLQDSGYARALVLKPTLLGGISRTLRLAERARSLGIPPVISSAYETGIGTLGLLALAAALGEAPAGLDPYRRLAEDVVRPTLDLGPEVDIAEALGPKREVAHVSLQTIG